MASVMLIPGVDLLRAENGHFGASADVNVKVGERGGFRAVALVGVEMRGVAGGELIMKYWNDSDSSMTGLIMCSVLSRR